MRRYLQSGLTLLIMAASALGVYNVLSDNADVERLATATACEGEPAAAEAPGAKSKPPAPVCRAQKTQVERNPIAQTFEFATNRRQVTVRCARSFVLVGEYGCALR